MLSIGCNKIENPIISEGITTDENKPLMKTYNGLQDNFFDNFEKDLSKWTGNRWPGWDYSAIIVDDPLRPDNKVVTFTEMWWWGG
jgi:hypothetical protein